MQQLQTDDFSYGPSGCTVILAQVVELLGKKDIQAREQAYNMLYVDRWESIKRYLVNRGLNEDHADELCQDTFERIWRQLMRLDKPLPKTVRHLNNWLYIIARSVANDDYRRKKPINYRQLTESDAYIQFDELLVDDKLWLRKELAQMPPKYRACVVLKYYGGYTQEQIAAIVRISEEAVSMNVKHGIEYLRKKSYPVTIDLKSAEKMKELKYLFINTMARVDRRFLDMKYTWDRQYTEEELRACDQIDQNVFVALGPHGELIPAKSPLILSLSASE
jgi:RNA polymerase sigma-70 factor (ECF subfamily)